MAFTYEEIAIAYRKYRETLEICAETGDYSTLAPFWEDSDDVYYFWFAGPDLPPFEVHGKEDFVKYVCGTETAGHRGWRYPVYHYKKTVWPVIIDPVQGYFIFFWDILTPYLKEDGEKYYMADSPAGTWVQYAGNGKFLRGADFYDSASHDGLVRTLMEKDVLDPVLKEHFEEMYTRKEGDDYKQRQAALLKKVESERLGKGS